MTTANRLHPRSRADSLADQAADKSEQAIDKARQAADDALDALHEKVDLLHDLIPGAFNRAATRVDELTRRGLARARQAGTDMRDSAERAGDLTVAYVKDEPVKSILIAAAAGAALVALIGMMTRSTRAAGRY